MDSKNCESLPDTTEDSANEFTETDWGRGGAFFMGVIDSQCYAALALAEARHPGRGRESWEPEREALSPLWHDIYPKHTRPIDRSWCSESVPKRNQLIAKDLWLTSGIEARTA